MTIEMKAIEQYFHVVLFLGLFISDLLAYDCCQLNTRDRQEVQNDSIKRIF